jgi:predicted SnoaL-like aldol condensation-catalyzing enzyme
MPYTFFTNFYLEIWYCITHMHKQSAVSFLQMVTDGKISEAYEKYVSPDMKHHNIWFAGDAASLQKGMEESHQQFPNKIFDVKHVIEEGDLVVVHSHMQLGVGLKQMALVHILRFDGDKIVEMWDVGEKVPDDSPNKNGTEFTTTN